MKEEIGLRIKQIRIQKHMTKEAFAKELGISGQFLGIIERGNSCLSIEKLERLCDFTGLSADYILFGKERNAANDLKNLVSTLNNDELEAAYKFLNEVSVIIQNNIK
jgi:transcriptional regulator with XRE-family HTH domain